MDRDFEIGDVVRLRSGGPKMTVTEVGETLSGQMSVWCTWFVGTRQETGTFPVGGVELFRESWPAPA
jgi:uncharacterized protein YodC (DUF2158 family)